MVHFYTFYFDLPTKISYRKEINLFLYDFYLGNRNCAEILGPIALVEMEAPTGKVLNRFHGFETG